MEMKLKKHRQALVLGLATALVACSDPVGLSRNARTAYLAVVARDAKLTGARVDGNMVVRGSQTLGRIVGSMHGDGIARRNARSRLFPVTSRDDEEDERVICIVLIRYWLDNGEIISVTVLSCRRPGGGNSCDPEKREIIAEYDNPRWPVAERATPRCNDIDHNGDGTTHFSWAELNGYFQRGNPHTEYGWVQPSLKSGLEALRTAWGESTVRRTNGYSVALPVTSGYRCPHGNTQVDGEPSSWHLEGRAADISTRTIAGISPKWNRMTSSQRAEIRILYNHLTVLAREKGARDLQPFSKYDDRHFHAAWQ